VSEGRRQVTRSSYQPTKERRKEGYLRIAQRSHSVVFLLEGHEIRYATTVSMNTSVRVGERQYGTRRGSAPAPLA